MEKAINDTFSEDGVEVKRYPGTLLHEPGSVLTGSGTGFKVFTPFWRAALKLPVTTPLPSPSVDWSNAVCSSEDLNSWVLDPAEDTRVPDWAEGWEDIWEPGEDGAHNALRRFLTLLWRITLKVVTFLHVATHRVYRLTLSSERSLHDRSGPLRSNESSPPPSGPARLISFSPKSAGESFVIS